MPYQFSTEDQDYSDFAGGRVLYQPGGLPAFPVRLASEIFQRARRLGSYPAGQRLTLYDLTCGGAYHLTALGFLHGAEIGRILASDVDERALALARRNLMLLSFAGLEQREQEIREMLERYGKASHAAALESVSALRERLRGFPPIATRVFQANATGAASLKKGLGGEAIHLVISDVPYGQLSTWEAPDPASRSFQNEVPPLDAADPQAGPSSPLDAADPQAGPSSPLDAARAPLWQMLEALLPALSGDSVVAIAADKAQKVAHPRYRRIERFQIGKRQVTFLSPAL